MGKYLTEDELENRAEQDADEIGFEFYARAGFPLDQYSSFLKYMYENEEDDSGDGIDGCLAKSLAAVSRGDNSHPVSAGGCSTSNGKNASNTARTMSGSSPPRHPSRKTLLSRRESRSHREVKSIPADSEIIAQPRANGHHSPSRAMSDCAYHARNRQGQAWPGWSSSSYEWVPTHPP